MNRHGFAQRFCKATGRSGKADLENADMRELPCRKMGHAAAG
jgi:hypothetical protein